MKAGKLDRRITIERRSEAIDDYGAITETWTPLRTIFAEKVESRSTDFFRNQGEATDRSAVFRVRWTDDLTTADRVSYDGDQFDILEITEIGRRVGLELRCKARNTQ